MHPRTRFLFFSEDHAIGLSTFTIMAGLGGSLGYAMGGIDWGIVGNGPINFFFANVDSFSKEVSWGIFLKILHSELLI